MNKYRKFLLISIVAVAFFVSTNLGFLRSDSLYTSAAAPAKEARDSGWKQKDFIITLWNASEPSISHYPQIAKEGYTVIPVNYNGHPLNDAVERLKAAKKNGLKIILGDELINISSLRDPVKLKKLDALIERIKGYSSLEGYFMTDEPVASKFNDHIELSAYIQKKDPGKLIYFNLLPNFAVKDQTGISHRFSQGNVNYPSHLHGIGANNKEVMAYLAYLRQFVNTFKPNLISYDHYPFFQKQDGQEYFLNMALISHVAKEAKKPFLNIVQAANVSKILRLPTDQEMRFQVYTTLAYGGRGISYYYYWSSESKEGIYRDGLYLDGKPSPLSKTIATINAEIKNLSPTLMSLTSQGVYHTNPLPIGGEGIPKKLLIKILSKSEIVLGLFGENGNASTFLISNRSYKNGQKVEIKVSIPGGRIQELNRKTGKWISFATLSSTRKIIVVLEPGDGRLFRVL
jgi:Beta-galactosidase